MRMTPEKELILTKFNTLKYIDNNIASIIDNYIYERRDAFILFGCNTEQYTKRYGKFHGEYIQFRQEGFNITDKIKIISHWKNGVLDGECNKWWSNGELNSTAMYKDGNFEGDYKEFHEDGSLRFIVPYINGSREGEYKRWWDNGQLLFQGYYKNNKYNGEYKEWDEDGKLIKHLEFKEGLKVKNYINIKGD